MTARITEPLSPLPRVDKIGIVTTVMEELFVACIRQPFASAMIRAAYLILWAGPSRAADCQRDNFDSGLGGVKQAAAAAFPKGRSFCH